MAGPLSRHLLQVGHQLRLGVPAELAWQPLIGLDSGGFGQRPASGSEARHGYPISGAGLVGGFATAPREIRGRVGERAVVAVQALLTGLWRRVLGFAKQPLGRRRDDVDAGRHVAEAARRSAESGAALSRSLTRCADDLRAQGRDHLQARLQRSAVWLVLPLGLCFLPAFLLAGLVPVVLAVLGEVL
jgi:hypothetical protein